VDSDQNTLIGQRISEAMARLGVSISELGLAWGGSRQTAQHWVHGRHLPTAGELPRLCRLLLIDANELLCLKPLASRSNTEIVEARKHILALANAARERQLKKTASPRKRLAMRKRKSSLIPGRLGS